MAEYRRGAHTVYEIHLHLVWTTKYRKPVLVGDAAARVRDLIREICGTHDVKIMKGHVSKDHVHLLVSIPPQVTISRLLQWLKGKTAHKIMLEFPHIKKHYWGQHMLRLSPGLTAPGRSRATLPIKRERFSVIIGTTSAS
jgi:putative transposase